MLSYVGVVAAGAEQLLNFNSVQRTFVWRWFLQGLHRAQLATTCANSQPYWSGE